MTAEFSDEQLPATYADDNGIERRERRQRNRAGEDPRIDHLFNGFDNLMLTAEANGDDYGKHYVKAMRAEFAAIALARASQPAAGEPTPTIDVAEKVPEHILGAVARGWCWEINARKEMDSDLALAIGCEVWAAVRATPTQQPATQPSPRTEPGEVSDEQLRIGVRAFQSGHNGFDDLSDWRAFYNAVERARASQPAEAGLPPLTDEQMRDLVKECGLDWQRGYMPLFDGDPTNRYAVLIDAARATRGADKGADRG